MEEYYFGRTPNGAVLGGEIRFVFEPNRVAQTNKALSSVDGISFSIDDQIIGSLYQLDTLSENLNTLSGEMVLGIDLSTHQFSNGDHVIATVEPSGGTTLEKHVVFQIGVTQLNPISHGNVA